MATPDQVTGAVGTTEERRAERLAHCHNALHDAHSTVCPGADCGLFRDAVVVLDANSAISYQQAKKILQRIMAGAVDS